MPEIELIPFTEEDIDRVLPWITSVESLELWTASSFGYPLTREHLQRHLQESRHRGDRLIFKAVDRDSREAIGHIELGAIDPRNHSLRIGRVLLAPACRGRGLGVELMRAALARSFGQLQRHRVELGVFDVNPRAIACYERAGFQREGMRRESFRSSAGVYWSEITMSILAREWAGRYSSEDVHRALFEESPEPRTLEELKEGVRRSVKARHTRR